MIPSFSEYCKILHEAKVMPVNRKSQNKYVHPDEYPPLKDSDTIRVYHGFRDEIDAIRTLKYGLSGKERANRVYSYEFNNNPKGIFVSISLEVAKEFGNYIIEFHAKVSDLEAPVWPGGGYTVQGQMSQYFDGDDNREQQRMKHREMASKSTYDSIKNSDRPELADLLYNSGEAQALFVGELDANSVRAVWVNPATNISGRYATFKRMSREEFLQKHGNNDKVIKRLFSGDEVVDDDSVLTRRLFKPREKFNTDILFNRIKEKYKGYKMDKDDLIEGLKRGGKQELLKYVWPNQLEDAWNAIKEDN